MRHQTFLFFLLLCLPLLSPTASAQDDAEGPTMGWSSWNTFGVNINETLIRQQIMP